MFRLITISILMMGWAYAGSAEESVEQSNRPEVVTPGVAAEPKKKQKKPKKSEKKHSEASKSPEMKALSMRDQAQWQSSLSQDEGLPPKSANLAQARLESSDGGNPPPSPSQSLIKIEGMSDGTFSRGPNDGGGRP